MAQAGYVFSVSNLTGERPGKTKVEYQTVPTGLDHCALKHFTFGTVDRTRNFHLYGFTEGISVRRAAIKSLKSAKYVPAHFFDPAAPLFDADLVIMEDGALFVSEQAFTAQGGTKILDSVDRLAAQLYKEFSGTLE